MPNQTIVTRFSPSPTGALHVGGARTALFSWAFARQHGGQFILRIEDTDVARSTPQSTRGIIADMAWLGMDWDQGPELPKGAAFNSSDYDPYTTQTGDHGPYFQSQRNDIYQQYLEKLQSIGRVYEDDGALRFRMPDHDITVHDLILGPVKVEKNQTQFNDFIIYRSPAKGGGVIFHFANIIDDAAMAVTHVIRGQEHLDNTIKHLALAEALEIASPQYAHIPLIFNPDGSKMSKRDKEKGLEVDVADFRESGYLPNVLLNYLALLGWNPGGDIEDFGSDPLNFLKEHFSLDRVQKGPAKFDRQKLLSFNANAIARMDADVFGDALRHHSAMQTPVFRDLTSDDARFTLFAEAYQPRAHTLNEPAELGRFFVEPGQLQYDLSAKPVKKMLRDQAQIQNTIADLRRQLISFPDWTPAAIDDLIETYAADHNLNMGQVAQPLRVAVAGGPVSPPIGVTLAILGKDKTIERINEFSACLAAK